MTTADPIATFRAELHSAALRCRRSVQRRRLLMASAAVAIAVIALTGVATGAVGWLTGTPAPQPVVADFGTYTPQLGFHPDPGSAVLVASDGDSHLYVTTNAEGSYCVAETTPSTHLAQAPDGGYCIGKQTAEQPIVAGVAVGGPDTLLLEGRVAVAGAVSVRVALADGTPRTIPLGTSGFFISNITAKPCQNGDWTSQLVALDATGKAVAASTITLERSLALENSAVAGGCWLVPLTSAKAPSVNVSP